ncbi:MAG: hypothetical protein JO323_25530 [Acidobacteriia bacterium]|nr:hypothetical protein [Terriglobia bacterium]
MRTPTDWSVLAKARGRELTPAELERIVEPLRTLESRFRPLAALLSRDCEPATVFHADPEPKE